jgi:ferredoxin
LPDVLDLPTVRVSVDQNVCGGHGNCVVIAPGVFEFAGDDDVVSVLLPDVPVDLEDAVARAQAACPNRAITTDT